MNIRRLWLKLGSLLAAAMGAVWAVPYALGYVTARSATLVNTFTAPAVTPGGMELPLPPPTGDPVPLGLYVFLLCVSMLGMSLLARRCK